VIFLGAFLVLGTINFISALPLPLSVKRDLSRQFPEFFEENLTEMPDQNSKLNIQENESETDSADLSDQNSLNSFEETTKQNIIQSVDNTLHSTSTEVEIDLQPLPTRSYWYQKKTATQSKPSGKDWRSKLNGNFRKKSIKNRNSSGKTADLRALLNFSSSKI
jgi:hypothetical protein